MIFTDGACSRNPGPGGWAAILNHDEEYEVITGYISSDTTNNRMELLAVVKAIKESIKQEYSHLIIHSDSAYVVNAINKGWINRWRSNGWVTNEGSGVKNSDLWRRLDKLLMTKGVTIEFKKVQAHKGNTFNELADKHAKIAVDIAKSKAN